MDCHVVPSGEEATLEHRRADLVIADIEASEADRTRLCRLVKRWVKPLSLCLLQTAVRMKYLPLTPGRMTGLKSPTGWMCCWQGLPPC